VTPTRHACLAGATDGAPGLRKHGRRARERFLLRLCAVRTRAIVLSLVVSLLSLALAVYGATSSRADAPAPTGSPATSLSAARFFVLLPDGRVEITDAWSRRVFRWDGLRWVQTESRSLARSDSR
jgi:hypothetical protein